MIARARRSSSAPPAPPARVQAAHARATIPAGPPLHLWAEHEAAEQLRIGLSLLQRSTCPRMKIGARVLYDPIETIAWARLHLSEVVTPAPAEQGT